ncbi:MAG: hypothetical protein Q8S13_02250, partial [Dehalococcoidia bacterium]|nr:hypothetical protein [Dehalococcoidia bacterium]
MADRVGVVATLAFPLPECAEEHDQATNAGAIIGAIDALDEWLRAIDKHGEGTVRASEVRKRL